MRSTRESVRTAGGAERVLQRREAILAAVSHAAERFLRAERWEDEIGSVLQRLGRATGVDRVHLFRNRRGTDGVLRTDACFEWAAEGVAARLGAQALQGLSYARPGLAEWAARFSAGECIHGPVATLPPDVRPLVAPDLRSFALVPVFTAEGWWGFAGFDACRAERAWDAAELYALRAFGGLLGAAIERRRGEEALLGSEARFRAVFDQAAVGICIADLAGRPVRSNPALQRILGYSAQELAATTLEELAHPADAELGLRPFVELMEDRREGYEVEQRLLRRDGTPVWARIRASLLRDGGGRPLHAVLLVSDVTEQRTAERALRESEERFREIAENAGQVIWLHDHDAGRTVYANPAFERIWGMPAECLYERTRAWAGSLHPADREQALRGADARLAGHYQDLEYRIVRPDGSVRWIRDRAFPIRGADGRIHRTTGLAEDVTEQRESEAALRDSEEKFRQLAENIREIFWMFEPDFSRVLYTSPLYEEIWGRTVESLYQDGASFLLSVHPEDRERVLHAMAHIRESGGPAHVEYRVVRPDGSTRWVCSRGFPVRDASGTVYRVAGTTEDTTERHLAEEALRRSEEFSRSVLESSTDCIKVLDLEGRLLSVNGPGRCLLEIDDVDSLRGSEWTDLWSAPAGQAAAREAVETARGGGSARFQAPCLTARGTMKWWDVRVTPIRDAEGRIARLLCISRDVTEERQMEEQLLQAQKMEAVGRLAGGVAHDFNNLLTAIRGHTHLLRAATAGDADVQEDLAVIAGAVDRAASLTSQLLTFSRRQMLQPVAVDLNQVVAETERMLRRTIGEDVEVVTELEPALGSIRVDPGQMSQILMNLAVNARDAMPTGGRLTLRTSNLEVALDAAPGAPAPGRYVRLEVIDTGSGMDEATRARIFEPFFTTKEVGWGTGLGLSTVYAIVQQTGGSIRVRSRPGQGTAFTLCLPRIEEPSAPCPTESPAVRGGSETILLVEDDPLVLGLVRCVLRRSGYHVLEAAAPADALRLHGELCTPVHLLLTDLVMPGMSGRELAERLVSRADGGAPRVLFMSGYTDDLVVHHGLREGQPFLRKPFSPEDLLRRVREVLDA